jgi:16S rRNA (guanine966-N2)-methyltransferase
MRVISGKFKGKKLFTDNKCNFRPTTDRNREMIFNIIDNSSKISFDISKAKVLDLFSGSGALSLEAISRGAIHATLIDLSHHHLQISRNNFSEIAPRFNANFYKFDLTKKFLLAKIQHNLIFIDPPYNMNAVSLTLGNAIRQNWLEKKSLIVAEIPDIKEYNIEDDGNYKILESKIVGKTKILFLEYNTNSHL